jgi:hypothetical protein
MIQTKQFVAWPSGWISDKSRNPNLRFDVQSNWTKSDLNSYDRVESNRVLSRLFELIYWDSKLSLLRQTSFWKQSLLSSSRSSHSAYLIIEIIEIISLSRSSLYLIIELIYNLATLSSHDLIIISLSSHHHLIISSSHYLITSLSYHDRKKKKVH